MSAAIEYKLYIRPSLRRPLDSYCKDNVLTKPQFFRKLMIEKFEQEGYLEPKKEGYL